MKKKLGKIVQIIGSYSSIISLVIYLVSIISTITIKVRYPQLDLQVWGASFSIISLILIIFNTKFPKKKFVRYVLGVIFFTSSLTAFLFWKAYSPLRWLFSILALLAILVVLYDEFRVNNARKIKPWAIILGLLLVITMPMCILKLLTEITNDGKERRTVKPAITLERVLFSLHEVYLSYGQNEGQIVRLPVIHATLSFNGFENSNLAEEKEIPLKMKIYNSKWNYLYVKESKNEVKSIAAVYSGSPDLFLIKGITIRLPKCYMTSVKPSIKQSGRVQIPFLFPVSGFPFQSLHFIEIPRTRNLQCRIVMELPNGDIHSNDVDIEIQGTEGDWYDIQELLPDLSCWEDFNVRFQPIVLQ